MTTRPVSTLAVLVALAICGGLAACGDDDASSDTSTAAPAITAAATSAPATAATSAAVPTSAAAAEFPVTIEHKYGSTVLAVDGDPTTVVPSAAVLADATASGTSGGAAEQEAAATVWQLVFDSAAPVADKLAHLEDAAALTPTLESYARAGATMGGITLVPTAVVVEGDSATVTYDVKFGEATAYRALTGTIGLVDGVWVVSRAEFCSFMASARNSCPAS